MQCWQVIKCCKEGVGTAGVVAHQPDALRHECEVNGRVSSRGHVTFPWGLVLVVVNIVFFVFLFRLFKNSNEDVGCFFNVPPWVNDEFEFGHKQPQA